MVETFRAFLQSQELTASGRRGLLAVSGGIDSVVMAHLFHHADFPCALGVFLGHRGEKRCETKDGGDPKRLHQFRNRMNVAAVDEVKGP